MKASRRKFTPTGIALVGVIVLGLGAAGWTHFRTAHAGGHDHHDHASAALSLNDGKRWQTDEALRTGLQRIRDAAAPALAAYAQGQLAAPAAKALAASFQDSVGYLMANCKLVPKADATLHVLLNDLMTGAGLLGQNPSSAEGVALIRKALQQYPEYFEHPGWRPLGDAAHSHGG